MRTGGGGYDLILFEIPFKPKNLRVCVCVCVCDLDITTLSLNYW